MCGSWMCTTESHARIKRPSSASIVSMKVLYWSVRDFDEILENKTEINKECHSGKKPVFIRFVSKSDEVCCNIDSGLTASLKRTYTTAKLVSIYEIECSLRYSKVDKYSHCITFNCIYQFICYVSKHID